MSKTISPPFTEESARIKTQLGERPLLMPTPAALLSAKQQETYNYE